MAKYTEEDLELLSEDERAALEEPDGDVEDEDNEHDAAAAQTPDPDAPVDGNDLDGGDDPASAETETPPQAPDPAQPDDDPGNDAQGADDEPADKAPAQAPTADITAAQNKIEELNTAEDDLFAKYDDGEIDDAEFKQQRATLRKEYREQSERLGRLQAQQEAAETEWVSAVESHLKEYPEIAENPDFLDAIDREQQTLSQTAAFRNAPHAKLLKAAHGAVAAAAEYKGVPGFPQLKTSGKAPPPAKASKPAPKAPDTNKGLGETPETLRDVPASAATDPDESEMAELQKLDAVEFENAWSRLTDEKRERLLRYA